MRLPIFSGKEAWKQIPQEYALPIYRPILFWSEDDVWRMLESRSIMPNPVYNRASRCNCGLCFQAKRYEILNFCRLCPAVVRAAADLEREIGHTWTERESIGNLLKQAQAQGYLFDMPPRFEEEIGKGVRFG